MCRVVVWSGLRGSRRRRMVWKRTRMVGRCVVLGRRFPVGRAKGGLLVGIEGGRLALVVWMIASWVCV